MKRYNYFNENKKIFIINLPKARRNNKVCLSLGLSIRLFFSLS